ncbi:MAG: ABC transporter ATP-binding protein/permease [Puniceicoccales bacterium]|jgi:subfamily B ATP-binding cassette protein MsbA|nr:ABC transporter ATP-binding protein/permease [Puniceicoccales bacterium]
MRRIFSYYRYLRPVRLQFLGALACGLVYGAGSGFGIPFVTDRVLPFLFSERGGVAPPPQRLALVERWPAFLPDWGPLSLPLPAGHALAVLTALIPLLFAVRCLAQYANTYLLNLVGVRVLEGVRLDLFAKLQRLHLGYFKRHKAGDLVSRVTNDTNHVRVVVVDISNDLMIQPFTLLAAVAFIVHQCLSTPGMERFLLALCAAPAVILPIRIFGRRMAKRSREMLERTGDISAMLTENLHAAREVRAYNMEDAECRRFASGVRRLFNAQMKMVKYDKGLPPLIEFFASATLAFAIYHAAGAGVPLKTATTLVMAVYFAYAPVKRLGAIHNKIKSAKAALDRLEGAVLDAREEVADPPAPLPLPAACGEVEFDRVTFRYDGAQRAALDGVSVRVAAGEVVALVGPSGAGKSTFANLVPRFYDPQDGAVRVGGANVRSLRQRELRGAVALVSQEPVLFNDTLYNNILAGRPDATRAEVVAAAERAGARGFIEAAPGGWDAPAGEQGRNLSGGQKQRIAIARAFLKDAPLLILDEATSALDAGTEALVQDALEKLARGRTTFIIAHRFSTIRFATRILVFERGRLIADGPHERLLAECPLYRQLHERQHERG